MATASLSMYDQGFSPTEPEDVEAWLAEPALHHEMFGGPMPQPELLVKALRKGEPRPTLRTPEGRKRLLEQILAPFAMLITSPERLFHFYCWAGHRKADARVVRWLARSPAARVDGPLLAVLAEHPSVGVHRILLYRLAEPLRTGAARRAAKEVPGFLVRAIETGPPLAAALSPEVWAALLSTDIRSIRERALACLPRRVL